MLRQMQSADDDDNTLGDVACMHACAIPKPLQVTHIYYSFCLFKGVADNFQLNDPYGRLG